jgi:hypothetical protein
MHVVAGILRGHSKRTAMTSARDFALWVIIRMRDDFLVEGEGLGLMSGGALGGPVYDGFFLFAIFCT